MLGTLKFSSRVQYGRNKRNVPYYLFDPDTHSEGYIVVASKQGMESRVDHYSKIQILEKNINPENSKRGRWLDFMCHSHDWIILNGTSPTHFGKGHPSTINLALIREEHWDMVKGLEIGMERPLRRES